MKSFTLKELAELTSSEVEGDPKYLISGIDELESATCFEVSFLDNPKYTNRMEKSQAGAIFVHPTSNRVEGRNYLLTVSPSLAFQKAINLFLPKITSSFSGIHPTAVIHPSVKLGSDVTVGPHVVIEANCVIGNQTTIDGGAFLGPQVIVGNDCRLHANVVIREGSQLGNRVTIQPGAVIGSCGFGYFTDAKGTHHPLDQRGSVVIEDDVEIGANTTIDRARFKTTRISRGSKIDNLVQIAHGVTIGEDNLIVSQVGIAGSTKTGKNVVVGGQVGIIGHITLTDGVMLAARSAASKSLTKPGIYSGAPAIPIQEFNEQFVLLRNIKKLMARVKKLEESKVHKEIAS